MALQEAFTLDGLALNDGTVFMLNGAKGVDMTPPAQRQDWIGAADSEAQLLVRDPLHENRKIQLPMIVLPQADMDTVHDKIGLVLDKLQKASKYPDGISLTWTAATGTRTVTFDVLAGQIVGLPVDWENGWLALSPSFTVELVCKPYWVGTVQSASLESSSEPFVTAEITGVTGDVPALGELFVIDAANQTRRHVEWGLEGPLTYNAATLLLIDSDDMVTSGFSGTGEVFGGTGAYDSNPTGNNAIVAALYPNTLTAVAGTGNLSHVGVFRVKARAYTALGTQLRITYRVGDGPLTSNAWATSTLESQWTELDLGTITIPAVVSGTQRWTGRVEAYNPDTLGNVHLDYLILIPVSDGYGKARATYTYQPGVVVGIDQFTSTTAGSALNGRTATSGGTWATSGATTDFAFADDLSGEQIKRSTTSDTGPRWAILGSTVYTDTQIETLIYKAGATLFGDLEQGVVARWTDSSNYLRATVFRDSAATTRRFALIQRVGGTDTTLATVDLPESGSTWGTSRYFCVRLIVFASGHALAWLMDQAKQTTIAEVEATSTVLGTGGTLQSGKPGIYDYSPSASSGARYYDDFMLLTPASEPIAINSTLAISIRWDDVVREDTTAAYWGRPPSYRGSRFLLPPGTSRVFAKARRNDIEVSTDDQVTDDTSIVVNWYPRGLAVPR